MLNVDSTTLGCVLLVRELQPCSSHAKGVRNVIEVYEGKKTQEVTSSELHDV